MKILIFTFFLILFSGCGGGNSTAHIQAVQNFDGERYLGKWFEIARLPHSFEEGMTNVYAVYSAGESEKITVENFGVKNGKWKSIKGYAQSKGAKEVGELEVTFFWPFSGEYRIIWLEPDYSSSIVTSSENNYLWILARDSSIDNERMLLYLNKLEEWGFEREKLIFPQQNQ